MSVFESFVEEDKRSSRSFVSGSCWYAVVQSRGVGIGRAAEVVVTRERIVNSAGELAASIEVNRWMSMRWLTKWEPRLKGQQVDRAAV